MNENFDINIDTSKYKSISDDKLNYFADVVELITLISKMEITVGEILDRFCDDELLTKGETQRNDSNERWVREIFSLLKLRWTTFKVKYPFHYDEKENILKLKESFNETHKLYIQLLLSANLPFFNQFQTMLTTDFENISYYSLKGYLNNNPNVKKFGKKTEYSGVNAIEKIKKLASDIKIDFSEDDIQQVNKYNSNEKGLDIVAWFPFDDNWGNLLVFLGQCACQNIDWHKKRQDTVPYEHFFYFKGIEPIHTLFIPHSLTSKKAFYHRHNISKTLLFERKRLLDNFDISNYTNLDSNVVIDKVLLFKEGVV